MTIPPDEELMLRLAREDDEQALVGLMDRYRAALMNHFRGRGVYDACEDLAQETFVRLYKSRHRYRVRAKFRTFLYHIAHTVWIDHWRKKQRRERRENAFAREAPLESGPILRGGGPDLDWALARLPATHRPVVVCAVFDQLSHAETAEILRIPVGTVKSRLHTALRELRRLLESDEAPPCMTPTPPS